MTKDGKRIESIDFIRSICILTMVLSHVPLSYNCSVYNHAYNMPLFFVVSGFFFKDSIPFKKYFKGLCKKILFPYFLWSFAFLAFCYITKIGALLPTRQYLINIFTTNNDGLPIIGAVWFLTALLIADLIYFFLRKKINNEKILTIICLIIMTFGVLFNKYTGINLWWTSEAGFVGVGLMHIGYLIKKYGIFEKLESIEVNFNLKTIIFVIIAFIFHYTLTISIPYLNMRMSVYPHIGLFMFNIVQSTIMIIVIYKLLIKNSITKKIVKELECFGNYSIVSVCLNQFYILMYTYFISKLNRPIPFYRGFMIIIVIGALYITTKLVMKTKLKVLFGK